MHNCACDNLLLLKHVANVVCFDVKFNNRVKYNILWHLKNTTKIYYNAWETHQRTVHNNDNTGCFF